jgi:biotin transporter BioY
MELIVGILAAFIIGAFIVTKLGEDEVKKEPESNTQGFVKVALMFVVGFIALSIIFSSIDSCGTRINSDYVD